MARRSAAALSRLFVFALVAVAALAAAAPAQDVPFKETRPLAGGVLNNKATTLAKPAYPAEARAAGAAGPVTVQVTIDETGAVTAARAASGHPLLAEPAEQAARQSKFAPTLIAGRPVKVTGVIVYNFVLSMSMMRVGYELALAEKAAAPVKFPLAALAGSLPVEWKEERDAVFSLGAFDADKPAKKETPRTEDQNAAAKEGAVFLKPVEPSRAEVLSVSRDRAIGDDPGVVALDPAGPEALAILRDVQQRAEQRLQTDDKRLWYFTAGRALGALVAEIESPAARAQNLAALQKLNGSAPLSVAEALVQRVNEIIALGRAENFDAQQKAKLLTLVRSLR